MASFEDTILIRSGHGSWCDKRIWCSSMVREIAGYLHGLMVKLRECGRSDMTPQPRRALIGRDRIEGEGESEKQTLEETEGGN
jgi:hypothetical protein